MKEQQEAGYKINPNFAELANGLYTGLNKIPGRT